MNILLAAADASAFWNLVAQITGIAGTAMCFFMFVARKRGTILLGKFTCDVLWTLHYGLIGAYSGYQGSLSFTISWSLLKLMSIELVMPSIHLNLCHLLLLLS